MNHGRFDYTFTLALPALLCLACGSGNVSTPDASGAADSVAQPAAWP